MRRRSLPLVALALFAACGGSAPATTPSTPAPKLVAVDIFGVAPRTGERLLAAHGPNLRRLGEAMIVGDPSVDREAIMASVRASGDFAYVEPALVGYFEEESTTYFLTIDIVERADAARRMTFLLASTGEHPDPEDLLADWQAYEAKVMELMGAGTMTLDFPVASDRNKAAAVLDRLLARPGADRLHREVIDRAGPTLLAMLRLQQPNNHDFAHLILKRISGKDYGARDYAVWEAWLQQASRD